MNAALVESLLRDVEDPGPLVQELWVFHHWLVARASRFAVGSIAEAPAGDLCRGDTDLSAWQGRRVRDVVREGLSSPEVVHRAAAMACLNASVRMAPSAWEGNAMDPFAEAIRHEPSCFVGHFDDAAVWRDAGCPVTIVELEPRPGDVHWRDADEALERASLVFITGQTLLNDTFEQVVARTPNARSRILMGPTCPASARLLQHGVHVVGGTAVTDADRLLRYLQYGGTSMRKAPAGAVRQFNIVAPGALSGLSSRGMRQDQ